MTDTPSSLVWPCINFADTHRARKLLTEVFGFTETLVVPGENPDEIVHGEIRWPAGGGIMFGSASEDGNEFKRKPTGAASLYVVTAEPDLLYERATEAGLEVVRELRDEEYGSRGFTVADHEGNLWSFGTYAGS